MSGHCPALQFLLIVLAAAAGDVKITETFDIVKKGAGSLQYTNSGHKNVTANNSRHWKNLSCGMLNYSQICRNKFTGMVCHQTPTRCMAGCMRPCK